MTTQTNNPIDIVVPDIGDVENVEVIELLVSAGDQVSVDDSLVTLESDKASMEIPATASGVIESLAVNIGDKVNSGDIIGKLLPSADSSTSEPNTTESSTNETSADDASTEQKPAAEVDVTTVDIELPSESTTTAATATTPAQASAPSQTNQSTQAQAALSDSPTAHLSSEKIRLAHASPGVRRYAREHGADLSLIKGTGPKERIVKTDVVAFIKNAMENIGSNYGAGGAATSGIPAIPEVDFSRFGELG